MKRTLLVIAVLLVTAACQLPGQTPPLPAGGSKDKGYTGTGTKVFVAGDSITYFGHDSLHATLADYSLRTFGVPGITAVTFDHDYGANLANQHPAVVVINLGTNDTGSPKVTEAQTDAALASLYGRFADACTVGVTVNEHMAPESHRDLAEAARLNTAVRGLADHVVEWSDAVAGRPDLFAGDRFLTHPDADGHTLLSGMIADAIAQC